MRSLVSGVGARLALALLIVLAGALAIVYLIVVPSLESRLVNARVSALELAAAGIARDLPADRFRWPDFLEAASASANARVVVYDTIGPPTALAVVGDSQGFRSSDVQRDPLALRTAERRVAVGGTTTHDDERFAEAAAPVRGSPSVLLVSSSLHEALATVRVARERLLVAGAFALVVALAVGYAGAFLFARRLRRLETAAERIAEGQFDQPITDTGSDEVGELARTFDRMRLRLAQLDHARREFIANASHELRTPVFSLGGFLELLRDEELDEETRREFLVTMSEQVDRLAKLATELLDLSRADAGRLRVERVPVDLGRVAETVVDEFTALSVAASGRSRWPRTVARGCSATSSACSRWHVRSSRTRSCTHRSERTWRFARSQGRSKLRTTAPGSPPSITEHVFDRFYRVEGQRASGSGLGLAIARELAQAMGGTLELESEPGRTVFRLRLAVVDSSAGAAKPVRA